MITDAKIDRQVRQVFRDQQTKAHNGVHARQCRSPQRKTPPYAPSLARRPATSPPEGSRACKA